MKGATPHGVGRKGLRSPASQPEWTGQCFRTETSGKLPVYSRSAWRAPGIERPNGQQRAERAGEVGSLGKQVSRKWQSDRGDRRLRLRQQPAEGAAMLSRRARHPCCVVRRLHGGIAAAAILVDNRHTASSPGSAANGIHFDGVVEAGQPVQSCADELQCSKTCGCRPGNRAAENGTHLEHAGDKRRITRSHSSYYKGLYVKGKVSRRSASSQDGRRVRHACPGPLSV